MQENYLLQPEEWRHLTPDEQQLAATIQLIIYALAISIALLICAIAK